MSSFNSRLKALTVAFCVGAGMACAGATGAVAQELKQIELTEEKVVAFIAAQKDFAPLAGKLAEGGETPDAALTKQLEEIAKKHGFASFAEFEDVGANVTIVLDGLDRQSGTYTDPVEKMKKELDEIKADATIPADDKKLAVDDLTQEIAAAQPLKYTSNIEVVKKHISEIEQLIPEESGESTPPADGEGPAP
jgi:lipase chaperone LimK